MTLGADRRGVTAPEFAIAAGVLLMMILGIFDLAVLYGNSHTVFYGVTTAARYAAANSSTDSVGTIKSAFVTAVTPALGATNAALCTVNVSFPGGNVQGGTVVVSASYPWKPANTFDALPAITLTSSQTLTILH
jgi:Flp pilus assembly protein TadG